MALIRLAGTRISWARRFMLMPRSWIVSCRISPGWMGDSLSAKPLSGGISKSVRAFALSSAVSRRSATRGSLRRSTGSPSQKIAVCTLYVKRKGITPRSRGRPARPRRATSAATSSPPRLPSRTRATASARVRRDIPQHVERHGLDHEGVVVVSMEARPVADVPPRQPDSSGPARRSAPWCAPNTPDQTWSSAERPARRQVRRRQVEKRLGGASSAPSLAAFPARNVAYPRKRAGNRPLSPTIYWDFRVLRPWLK